MRPRVVLRGQALERPRAHDLQPQIDDPLVGREQLRVDHRHLVGELLDGVVELLGGHRLQHQPARGRFRARNAVARQQHPLGELRTGVVEPHVRGRRAHRPHRREADHRVLSGDDDIAQQHQIRAAGQAVAVHLADHRLVHVEDRHPRALGLFHPPCVVVERGAPAVDLVVGFGRVAAPRREVVARRKRAPRAAQNHAVHGGVVVRLPHRAGKLILQGNRKRVELLRPVERDVPLAVAHLVKDVLVVGHLGSCSWPGFSECPASLSDLKALGALRVGRTL